MRLTTLAVVASLILAAGLSLLTAAFVYEWYVEGLGLGFLVGAPVAVLLLLLLLVLTVSLHRRGDARWAYGLATAFGLTFLFTLLSLVYRTSRHLSPVKLRAEFYYDEGFDLELRADGSAKATIHAWFEHDERYGKYTIAGDSLFLRDLTVTYGSSRLRDTLLLRPGYLVFDLEGARRGISRDSMLIRFDRR